MEKRILLLVLFLASWPPALAPGAEDGFGLVRDSGGIRVYSRPVAGSDLREFRGVTEADVPAGVLAMVLKDVEQYPAWMSYCEEATVLRDLGHGSTLVRYVQDMPWPVSDRDVVFRADVKFLPDAGRMDVSLTSVADSGVPPAEGYVRMAGFEGRMELACLGPGRSRVRFTMWADPAGSLPAMAVNAGAADVPYETLLGLMEMARREKYIREGASPRAKALFKACAGTEER